MADNGYITQEQADASKKKPIVTRGQPQPVRSVAPFFTEEVRKYLEQKYGAKALYESGLSVQTGIDIRLQRAANRAVDRGLRLVDKRRGYRRDKPNIVAQGQNLETLPPRAMVAADRAGRHRPGRRHERVADIRARPHRPADRRASRRRHRMGDDARRRRCSRWAT